MVSVGHSVLPNDIAPGTQFKGPLGVRELLNNVGILTHGCYCSVFLVRW